MRAQTRTQVIELLRRYEIKPKKALGQHFLADPNIIEKIVRLANLGPTSLVLEVGAGTGTLTRALAATGARVVTYEMDESLTPLLAEVLSGAGQVEVRFADITTVDLGAQLDGGPWSLVANLPYNVGTPLVLDILRSVPTIDTLVVMVQLEVARRFVAEPGTSDYGLPSVVTGLHADAKLEFRVPPQVFVPAPNVGSAVVSMRRVPDPPGAEKAIALASAAFSQRRKMLRRSLADRLHAGVLDACGIAGTARPEELSPNDWLALAERNG